MRWFLFWMPLVEEKKSGLLAAAYLWLRIKEEWNSCIAFVRCALFLLLFLPNLNSLNGSVSTFNGIQNDLHTNKKHKTTSFGSMCQHCNTWKTTLSDLFSGPRKKCENNWVIIVNSYEKIRPSSDLNLDHALAHFMKIKIHFCMHSERKRTHTHAQFTFSKAIILETAWKKTGFECFLNISYHLNRCLPVYVEFILVRMFESWICTFQTHNNTNHLM